MVEMDGDEMTRIIWEFIKEKVKLEARTGRRCPQTGTCCLTSLFLNVARGRERWDVRKIMPDVGEGFFQRSSSHWLVAPAQSRWLTGRKRG